MSSLPALSHREREVLSSIVELYIETGEPVASRTISRLRAEALSAASIRNVMADLSEAGYLEQPHTSAGRVPTEKAFRFYVQSLVASRLPAVRMARIPHLAGMDSPADWVMRSSHLLTEMTRNIGMAAAIPTAGQTLDQVELLKLSDSRVLMIVVTADRAVRHRVVSVPEEIPQDDLNSIRNYLNAHFSGWKLTEIRGELARRLEVESAAYDAILKRLMLLLGGGLLDFVVAPEFSLEGASNLVGLDLHLTREKMRDLFRALEEKKRMLELLDRFLEHPAGELDVHVGLGDAHPAMKQLSLIGLNMVLPGGLSAKVAVLGPIRMNYERVIAAVLQVGYASA